MKLLHESGDDRQRPTFQSSQVIDSYGGPGRTRICDLYRVKVAL